MEWQFIVILIIVVPLILFPAAFVWFLNISGVLKVIADSRAREKRRVQARKEALTK